MNESVGPGGTAGVTVDIDVGGTFTDGFFGRGGETHGVKVDTTPHDLTVCFWACLEEGAGRLGYVDLRTMLVETSVIRFSTTVGTNAILQGTGPRLGLIVSNSARESIYGPEERSPLFDRFLDPELVISVPLPADGAEQTDGGDEREAAVRDAFGRLLATGARHVVVALAGAGRNGSSERHVKAVIGRYFPRHYLGSVPLLLSTEARSRLDDFTRTNVAVINAYLHAGLATALYRADDRLRAAGFRHPLLVTHNSGGVARVAKTRAIDTYNSGPVAGLYGCGNIARHEHLDQVVTVDVGGTSTDIGLVSGGTPRVTMKSRIADVPVDLPLHDIHSIAAGGGSIARVSRTGLLSVGPDSAGAVPGPVAYKLGGTEPTLTDAYLLLGYLDPAYFLGGRRTLDVAAAAEAIATRIAGPLGLDADSAALRIVDKVVETIAQAVRRATGEHAAGRTALFAFGGGGGLLAARLADELGMDAYLFDHGAVLNAFGSSQMDIVHVYERAIDVVADEGAAGRLRDLAGEMEVSALRDMRGEGFGDRPLEYALELEIVEGDHDAIVVRKSGPDGPSALVSAVLAQLPSPARIAAVRLHASVAIEHAALVEREERGSLEEAARPQRDANLSGTRGHLPVFDRSRLRAGVMVPGPAIVEGPDTTILVPAGRRLLVDGLRNLRLMKVGEDVAP